MAGKSRDLRIIIAGDADKLDRELKRADRSLDKLGKQTRLTSSISSKGYAAMRLGATGAAASVAGLALAGKKVADAYIEAEKSEARMRAQLKASGISYGAHAKAIERSIQATSRLAAVDDEDLQDAFTNIVRVTGDVNRSLNLTGLAADIAAAKHIDVAKAGELVGKVAGGNVGILRRYGIQVKEGASASEALAAVQKKFAGQAEAYGRTTGGAMDRARVSIENLSERVGERLAPTIERGANKLARFVDEMSSGTGQGGRFVDTLEDVWRETKPIVTWIGRAAKNVGEFTAQHPRLRRLAGGVLAVGVAVKALRFVSAVTGFSTLLKGGTAAMKRLVKIFATQGAVAGAASGQAAAGAQGLAGKLGAIRNAGTRIARSLIGSFTKQGAAAGAAAGTAAAGGQGLTSAASFNKVRGSGRRVGRIMGRGMIVGVIAGLVSALPDLVKWISTTPLFSPKRLGEKIGKRIGKALGTDSGTGDGIGRALEPFMGGAVAGGLGALGSGKGAGDLRGANSGMRPFAALGAKFGLSVSPQGGLRPGATTRSGNQSWHATGEAIDLVGSPSGMMRYFRAAKAKWGGRLAELIYTPGGVGIKHGRPHTYTGQTAADHYDHVHTAFDLGTPGQGIGPGGGGRATPSVPSHFSKRPKVGDGPGRVRGRVSVFGPPLEAAGTTANGMSSSAAGIALNINPGSESGWNNAITNRWVRARQKFRVTIAGKSAVLPVIDKGPAGWTKRAIDVTGAGARAMGINPRRFPTDAIGTAVQVGAGGGSSRDRPGPSSKPDTRGGVAFPTARPGKIIGGPGEGTHSRSGGPNNWQSDNAIDVSVPVGTIAIAVVDGTITRVTEKPSGGGRFAGSSVTLQGKNNAFFYAHLSSVAVKQGQKVKQGDTIGKTGSASGVAHLHFGQQRGNPSRLRGLAPFGRGGGRGSDAGSASAADTSDRDEREGSRIVSRVGRPFFRDRPSSAIGGRGVGLADKAAGRMGRNLGVRDGRGITSLTRFERGRARVIDEKNTEYAQAERRFGQSEEDLGTGWGRAKRGAEIAELRRLKAAQLSREQKRLQALKALVTRYDGLIRALRAQLKKKGLKAATKAKIRDKLREYEGKRDEFAAEARTLGLQIEDTKLDLGDLDKEAREVSATPDTPPETADTPPDAVSPADAVGTRLSDIDLQERAGILTPEEAKAHRIATLKGALAGAFGVLDERQAWQLMGDLRDIMGDQVQAASDLAQALRDVKASIDAQLAYAGQVSAVTSMQAVRMMSDVISGNVGQRVASRGFMPGDGALSRL